MIEVVNKHKHTKTIYDVYVGRGSPLGNPFTSSKDINKTKAEFQCESREEAIEMFGKYLEEKIKGKDKNICTELNGIYKLSLQVDVFLVCFCKDKACHGDIIKKFIEDK